MEPLEDLIKTKEFWMVRLQLDLFNAVEDFRERKGWTRSQLADHLGVTKSYVSQVLNGDFDRRLSSLVTMALAVGVVPNTTFQAIEEFEEEYMSGRDAARRRGEKPLRQVVLTTLNPVMMVATADRITQSLLVDHPVTERYVTLHTNKASMLSLTK
jgi:transcriptional regulator with XRE-family HTH domain